MNYIIIAAKNFFSNIKNCQQICLEKLIRLTIYLGVLFLPLFFIPLSNDLSEYSKVILFYILVLMAVIFWLIKVFLSKAIQLEFRFLDVLVFLLVFVYLISSLFAIDTYNSLLGKNLSITNSFFSLCFLFVFYLLVSRYITKIRQVKTVFQLLIISILIIVLSNLIPILPGNQGFIFGLAINSFNLLLIFAFIACGILFLISDKKKIKYLYLILGIVFLLSLFFIDNQYILLLLALAIFIFIFLLSFKSTYFSNKLVVSLTLLLFITVIILILPIHQYTGIITPMQFNLPTEFAWQISKATLANNLLFATGPQNFVYSFYQYKTIDFNLTPYWQLGFTKSANFWLEIITTCGVIALLIFIAIFFKFFQYLFSFIKNSEINGTYTFNRYLIIVALSVIICIYIIWGFIDNFHFTLLYYLFLFLALATSFLQTAKQRQIFVNKSIINLGFYVLVILLVSVIYFISPLIVTDINFEKINNRNYETEQDYDQAIQYVKSVVKNNPQRVDYRLKLANLYIGKLILMKSLPEADYDKVGLENNIFENLTIILNTDNQIIDNYLGLRQAYNTLTAQGYKVLNEQEQINKKLLKLDPNNPELYIDSALINFTKYRAINEAGLEASDEEAIVYYLNQIKADLEKSIELKTDFVLGYYNLGLYWQELGDQEKALEEIYNAYTLDPSQQLIVLSLKKLYLNQDKVEEAISILKEYLDLKPDDYQARSELAVIYKNQNEIEKAKAQIDFILNQDPENELARQLLSEIE